MTQRHEVRPSRRSALAAGVVLVAAVTLGTGGLAPASASPAEPITGSGGALATYNGRTIDLSQSWEGAGVCVEQADTGSFECYADDAAYRAATGSGYSAEGVLGLSDCEPKYLCLWDNRLWHGRRVQFIKRGEHDLRDVGFMNRANSFFNNRANGAALEDYYSADACGESLLVDGREAIGNLSSVHRPRCGGDTWNNKIDSVFVG